MSEEILRRLPSLPRYEVDALDVGVIEVDDTGRILLYNRRESEKTGISVPDAEGQNLFTELAPCMNNALIYGRFCEAMQIGQMDFEVPYALTYRMRPALVQMRLWRDDRTERNYVLIRFLSPVTK